MQFEYLANVEFHQRERRMKRSLPIVRVVRDGLGKQTQRPNRIRKLLHLD